ncbi:hypothetical protein DICPUDRAFT_39465 [Dictyostelium purpureum]|uniref:EGF-like domain-containing protein n=1 Tax=Dictyostelium purpureum TaxID=5786 RepID=F0ZWC8_DICPU|nr:uncharacterized protein DICPUDRAFT_39465 [Dictyostelium purpureum]EGC31741.1 hypothetical protein DICPUDRAFT_39465 [Dictyostelium purpureum]|eukprot:XP_003291721.1 hypothetical protein DICPUDRAFT_39465 [Dictyostelium purpureum]
MTGSVTSRICSYNDVTIQNTELIGDLPSCVYCYLTDQISSFQGNSFSNYNPPAYGIPKCNSIVPNFRRDSNKLYLFGSDLGFNTDAFTTVPPLIFNLDVPSKSFYTTDPVSDVVEVYFEIPNQSFLLDSSLSSPTIDRVTVSSDGDGYLTFFGYYYTYNISTTSAKVGNEDCIPVFTNFTHFICQVNNYDSTKLNIASTLYIDGRYKNVPISMTPGLENKYLTCSQDCSKISNSQCRGCNNGICVHMDKCQCRVDYHGSTCLIKQHYVSSLTPTTIEGGLVIAFGDFGDSHSNLSILIGSEICSNPKANKTTIECTIGPGTGSKSFTVKQNDLIWSHINFYSFINLFKSCPNNCTSIDNGQCNNSTGQCKCIENKWSGFDCSSPILDNGGGNEQPGSSSNVDTDSGITQISNQDTKFNISIVKLIELDTVSQKTVREFELKKTWDSFLAKNTSDGNIQYIFNQTLGNNTANIIYKIEEVKKSKTFEFADEEFSLPNDSIKITIEINNFPFLSVLNSLQLQMVSSVENEISANKCNEKESSSENIQDQATSYVKISKDNKLLYGRFMNKIISDSRVTFISSEIVSNTSNSVIVGLNLPHCVDSCIIDPDFSVLIAPNFQSSCKNDSKKTMIIAVSIVVPLVVIAATIIVFAVVYRKNRISIKVKTMKLRRF